ncbi:MAG: E3 binding domain-containing protein [Acidimicrobiales bacterium]|jgi:NaMN:DMB phosphoribosyltransferase
MSPRGLLGAKADVTGSGPDGRITADDIRAKAEELAGGVESQVQSARPLLMYAAVGGALLVTLAAFWLGRRSGRRRSTVVEIRRG